MGKPRVVWLRETIKATDELLVLCRRDSEAVELVVAGMGEQMFGQMIADMQKLRANLAAELEIRTKSAQGRKRTKNLK